MSVCVCVREAVCAAECDWKGQCVRDCVFCMCVRVSVSARAGPLLGHAGIESLAYSAEAQ